MVILNIKGSGNRFHFLMRDSINDLYVIVIYYIFVGLYPF